MSSTTLQTARGGLFFPKALHYMSRLHGDNFIILVSLMDSMETVARTSRQQTLFCQSKIVIVISGFLKRYSKAKRTSLFTSAVTNQRGVYKGVKRSSGPISRVSGGDRVAVRVGVVEMGRGMIRWVRVGVFEERVGWMVKSSRRYVGWEDCREL